MNIKNSNIPTIIGQLSGPFEIDNGLNNGVIKEENESSREYARTSDDFIKSNSDQHDEINRISNGFSCEGVDDRNHPSNKHLLTHQVDCEEAPSQPHILKDSPCFAEQQKDFIEMVPDPSRDNSGSFNSDFGDKVAKYSG